MTDNATKPITSTETHSIKLLHERIPNFVLQKYLERWNRYRVFDKLGEGGMAVVHRALDTELSREVAVKIVSNGTNADIVARFLDEIQLHARLQHPSTAPMYDFGLTPEGHLFMTMELVFGESLKSIIARYHESDSSGVHLAELLDRFSRVSDALAFAHANGIVHRDVKPENIMCGDFGKVFLMDWGLATTFRPKDRKDSGRLLAVATEAERAAAHAEIKKSLEGLRKTSDSKRLPTVKLAHRSVVGTVVGTVGFMPPEQALGRTEAVDDRSDVYSLGCVLYAILCGKSPVSVDDENKIWQVLDNVIDGKILQPDQRGSRHSVPKSLAAIAMKAIAREPRDRYQSIIQVRQAVLDWMHQQAEANLVIAEVEEAITAAEEELRQGRPEAAQNLMLGATDKLVGVDGVERLVGAIQGVSSRAAREISDRAESDAAIRSYKELRDTIIESQFGLILSHLRVPAPTMRRAHDRLLKALQNSGVWIDPRAMLDRFLRFNISSHEGMRPATDLREELIYGLFLFGWASTRMAEVTSAEHGRDMFMNHTEIAMERLGELSAAYRAPKLILARIRRLRGNAEDAQRLEDEAEAMPIASADDYIFLATISFSEYRLEVAREQLLTALSLDPGAFWGHALMIFVSNGLGDQRGAFAALNTCQAIQPREPNLWTMRGFLERELGQFDKALESLDRALRYGPGDPLARLIRADLRKRMGRIDWQRDLDSAADLVTPPVSTWDHFVLALISLYKNDLEYAIEFVRAAQRRSPDMPQLYGLEASIWVRLGDLPKAEILFRKALDMAPNDPRLAESLLGLLVHEKRYGEARAKFLENEEHRSGMATASILLLAARAFAGYSSGDDERETGDEARALSLLERATAMQTISHVEVDQSPEFAHLRGRPEFKRITKMLRDGPPSPRLFQPTIEDSAPRSA